MSGPYPHSELQHLYNQKPIIPSNTDPNATLSEVLFRSIWQFNPHSSNILCCSSGILLALPCIVPEGLAGSKYSNCCLIDSVHEANEDFFCLF